MDYKHRLAEYNAAGKKKVNMEKPEATLLTGTPRQVLNLITDAENGLFSRFIFYVLNLRLVWNDVFRRSSDTTLSISPRTADRIIRRWCASGQLTNIAHSKNRKKDPP